MTRFVGTVALLWALGCGGKAEPAMSPESESATPVTPEEPAGAADPNEKTPEDEAPVDQMAIETCEDACTEIAVCWEAENDGDYAGGGMCVMSCDELDADELRPAFFECVAIATDCAEMLACER